MRRIRKGDLLIVKSIDRLGRNYTDILNEWRRITKEKEADILVLDMPLLDTRPSDKDLTGVFISELVLQILAYVAETERNYIRQRQKEGIASAKARGIRFGRPNLEQPEEFDEIAIQWEKGTLSAREAGRLLGVDRKTFVKWVKE